MKQKTKYNWTSFLQSKKVKRIILIFWLILVFCFLGFYLFNLEAFTPEKISNFLSNNQTSLLILYIFISLIRGLFFIPSTPFVFAGIILFPNHLFWVYLISLLGVCCSASFIYYFANYLELNKLIFKGDSKVKDVSLKINQFGFWIVLGWSFFPIVPTDLICYVAGITKMKYWKFILALFLGEAILIAIYVWFGDLVKALI